MRSFCSSSGCVDTSVTHHSLLVTSHTSVTHHSSHITSHTSLVTHHTSHCVYIYLSIYLSIYPSIYPYRYRYIHNRYIYTHIYAHITSHEQVRYTSLDSHPTVTYPLHITMTGHASPDRYTLLVTSHPSVAPHASHVLRPLHIRYILLVT